MELTKCSFRPSGRQPVPFHDESRVTFSSWSQEESLPAMITMYELTTGDQVHDQKDIEEEMHACVRFHE